MKISLSPLVNHNNILNRLYGYRVAHMLKLLQLEQIDRLQKEKAGSIPPFKAGDAIEIGVSD